MMLVFLVLQAAQSTYDQYMSLAEQHAQHASPHSSADLLCDRCLQPIDEDTFNTNAWRLEVRARPPLAREVASVISHI